MRPAELKEIAKRLNTPYENLYRLQELFLKRRQLIRSRQIRGEYGNRSVSPNNSRVGAHIKVNDSYDPNIGFTETEYSMSKYVGQRDNMPYQMGRSMPEWKAKNSGLGFSKESLPLKGANNVRRSQVE